MVSWIIPTYIAMVIRCASNKTSYLICSSFQTVSLTSASSPLQDKNIFYKGELEQKLLYNKRQTIGKLEH